MSTKVKLDKKAFLTLTFIELGARPVISFCIRSAMPLYYNQNQLHTKRSSRNANHGSTTRHDYVTVEVLSDVEIALHDRVVGSLVDTSSFQTEQAGLEEGFRSTESLVANSDDLSVWQFVRLFESRGLSSGLHLLFKVESDVAELFLDVTDDSAERKSENENKTWRRCFILALGGGGERVTALHQDLDQVAIQKSELRECAQRDTNSVKSRPARSIRRMA